MLDWKLCWSVADPGFTNEDEAPQAPRGWGVVTGVPRRCPSPENFFELRSQNGDFWYILGTIFYSSAIWFKCKNVVSRVKSTAKPAY